MATSESVVAQSAPRAIGAGAVLRRCFGFPVLLGAVLLAGVFAGTYADEVAVGRLFAEGDTWWHIATGQRILSTHTWPTSDPFSFTASGQNWMAYEWLGEVVMALARRWGGLAGMAALLLSLVSAIMLLLYYYCYLRSGSWKAAFVGCTALLPLAFGFFTLRPQLMGYVLLLVTLICLERYRRGRQRNLWILPLVFLVWVNTHGSFVLGLFTLGVYWASGLFRFEWGGLIAEPWPASQRRHLAWVFLASLVGLCITPYGSRLAAYPLQVALLQPISVANIYEWAPLPFDLLMGKLFLGLLILFLLALLVLRPTFRLEEVGLLLAAIYASCMHRRFALLFIVVFTPFLTVILGRWVPPYKPHKDRYVLNGVLILLLLVGLLRFFPSSDNLTRTMTQKFPVGAVKYLERHPPEGRMYNEYFWGGYLIWTRPGSRVFIDGRADIYEYVGVFPDYLDISRMAPNTLFLLRKYDIGACLVQPNTPLSTLLRALPDWQITYEDKTSALFVHKQRHSDP